MPVSYTWQCYFPNVPVVLEIASSVSSSESRIYCTVRNCRAAAFFRKSFSFFISSSSLRSLRFSFIRSYSSFAAGSFQHSSWFFQPVPDSVLGNVVLFRQTSFRPSFFRVLPHYSFLEFFIVTCHCFSLLC